MKNLSLCKIADAKFENMRISASFGTLSTLSDESSLCKQDNIMIANIETDIFDRSGDSCLLFYMLDLNYFEVCTPFPFFS